MNEIKRYDYTSGMNGFGEFHIWMEQDAEGGYVKFEDHEAEVARLRAELQNAAKAALDAVALSCKKEREADAMRAKVEGLRSFVADYVSAYRNGFDGDDHLLNLARSLLGPTVGDQDV